MRPLIVMLLIACTVLFFACEKHVVDSPEQTLKIKLNQCINPLFSGNRVTLCFDSVITDSRCPANAVCIWQGYAACKFSISSAGETYPFSLSTLKLPGYFSTDTTIAGYKLEFINLEPYPGTVQYPVSPDKIKAELKVTKL